MKTTYLKNKMLDHFLGKTTYTKPTNTYLAFFTDDPTVAGLTGKEVSGGSYARQQVTWRAASNGFSTNSAMLTSGAMPAAEIKYWGIYDASTAGNLLEYQAMPRPFKVPSGETIVIQVDNLILKES